jgi:precorrin-4 methylase
MKQSQSMSTDQMAQRLKELELEKKTMQKRMEQLDQDLYKANREKTDAMQAMGIAQGEA